MIGDNRVGIIANTSRDVRVTRAMPVSMSADDVHELDVLKKTPGAYQSTLSFSIRFTRNEVFGPKRGKPFLLKIDLFDNVEACGHRVVDFDDLCSSEKFKEFVPFLLEFTNISQSIFDIARANPTLEIPIAFDVEKYIRRVKEKNNIENFTFLSPEATMLNCYIEEDKLLSRKNAKKGKSKKE